MRLISTLIEKSHFYPLHHLSSGGSGPLFFQARGDGFYPLIKDGDVLRVQQGTHLDLRAGDLTILERTGGTFVVHLVLRKDRETQKALPKTKRNRVSGNDGLVKPERLVGCVVAIEREGRTTTRNDRRACLSHIIYFGARPVIVFFLIIRKTLSLFQPKFFVRDPQSSLHTVAQKFDEDEEVCYHSQRAFEGLDDHEKHVVEHFMKRRGKVLIIGCGAGREAFALTQVGFNVVGIDVAPKMIAEARRHARDSEMLIEFAVKDASALNYPANSFDYVLMSGGVYSHIPTRQLRINALRKINDLLTRNGILFLPVLYRRHAPLSRVSLYDTFRRIAKSILKKQLHAEPGDILVRYVSPVSTSSKLCYLHLFKDAGEVLQEISAANLDGFEDEKSGYWVVTQSKEDNNQGKVVREVAG